MAAPLYFNRELAGRSLTAAALACVGGEEKVEDPLVSEAVGDYLTRVGERLSPLGLTETRVLRQQERLRQQFSEQPQQRDPLRDFLIPGPLLPAEQHAYFTAVLHQQVGSSSSFSFLLSTVLYSYESLYLVRVR